MRMLTGAILIHAAVVALCTGGVCYGTDCLYNNGLADLMLMGGGLLSLVGGGMVVWGAYLRSGAAYESDPVRPSPSSDVAARVAKPSHS